MTSWVQYALLALVVYLAWQYFTKGSADFELGQHIKDTLYRAKGAVSSAVASVTPTSVPGAAAPTSVADPDNTTNALALGPASSAGMGTPFQPVSVSEADLVGCCHPYPQNSRPRNYLYDFRGDAAVKPANYSDVVARGVPAMPMPQIY